MAVAGRHPERGGSRHIAAGRTGEEQGAGESPGGEPHGNTGRVPGRPPGVGKTVLVGVLGSTRVGRGRTRGGPGWPGVDWGVLVN